MLSGRVGIPNTFSLEMTSTKREILGDTVEKNSRSVEKNGIAYRQRLNSKSTGRTS